ncbi:hypothetical protein [Weissella cibaria]|uniref:hypothetical protein n=1 Tax=Weissella cibaria TaxID=137591 RepID=UPI0011953EC9|nr:hypothetical protein [Weissella cibaria]TVV32472.1 hypothetical protein FO434_09665 [Weissella cibaria]
MNNTSVSDNQSLVEALNRLVDVVGAPVASPWLSKIEAYTYLKVAPKTFQKLIDKGAVRSHSLFEYGVTKELFNRNELDEAIKRL